MYKLIRIVSIMIAIIVIMPGCTEYSLSTKNASQLSKPSSANATNIYPSSTLTSDSNAGLAIPNTKYINVDTLLNKHVAWSALNDDIIGALCFMRMGEKEPFDCYIPIVQSEDVEYYTKHNYDDRTVIGGATQVLGDAFKQDESGGQMLIFGYRLGISAYFDTDFASTYSDIFLLTEGEITQFKVFGIQNLPLEHTMDYTEGVIPTEAYNIIETLESYNDEEKLLYYEQIANISQIHDITNSKVLILCSDGIDNDKYTMSVLYAYEIR